MRGIYLGERELLIGGWSDCAGSLSKPYCFAHQRVPARKQHSERRAISSPSSNAKRRSLTMTSPVVSMPSPQGEGKLATRTYLTKSALPSILGMYAFAAGTFIVAARMAHWYGNTQSAMVLFPLVLILGGLAQFYAGAWAFHTNDAVALAMHGTWGSFWVAYGILEILYATGRVVRPQGAFPELGFWFVAVAAITWGITAAAGKNKAVATVLTLLALGSTIEAVAELAGADWLRMLAGYFLIASALVAWYVASTLIIRFGEIDKARPGPPVVSSESARVA
jgi:hypothetical protein